ncbi:MAG: hypothetical protein ACI4JK_09650 [Oscillospiraceae bacterium]
MSELNKYAQRLNDIVKAAAAEYSEKETAFNKAQKEFAAYPRRVGIVTPEYAARSARAEADYVTAKHEWETLQRNKPETVKREVAAIRRELSAETDKLFGVAAKSIDAQALELLKSGIMRPAEYVDMIKKAKDEHNYTMARLAGKYALEAAEKFEGEEARLVRGTAFEAVQLNGNEYLQQFDTLTDILDMCFKHPYMFEEWDGITAEGIANF